MRDEEIGLNFFTEGEPRTPDGLPSVFGGVNQAEMLARIDEVEDDDLAGSFFADSLREVEEAATRVFDVGVRARDVPPPATEDQATEPVGVVIDELVEPVVVEPVVVEPVVVEPVVVEPVLVEPVVVEPVLAEQSVAEPPVVEPPVVEPPVVEPPVVEPPVVEPPVVEPPVVEPPVVEPPVVEPPVVEPPVVEPPVVEPPVVEPPVVEPPVVEQPVVEQPVVEPAVASAYGSSVDSRIDDELGADEESGENAVSQPVPRLGVAREAVVAMQSRTVITVPGILSSSAEARRAFILGGPAALSDSGWG